jgi:hypothetical protein
LCGSKTLRSRASTSKTFLQSSFSTAPYFTNGPMNTKPLLPILWSTRSVFLSVELSSWTKPWTRYDLSPLFFFFFPLVQCLYQCATQWISTVNQSHSQGYDDTAFGMLMLITHLNFSVYWSKDGRLVQDGDFQRARSTRMNQTLPVRFAR